jgi:rSAM/selenodomain-associated transferase 2
MSKSFALILVPFFIDRRNWKKSFYLLLSLASYVPFWDTRAELFTSLVPFSTVMHYNDSLAGALRAVFGWNTFFVILLVLVFCLSFIYLTVHDRLRSAYLSIGVLLLLLPTLHPWYLTLMTPFLVFYPSRAWLFLHFAMILTFPALHVEYRSGILQEINFVKLFEFLPFYAILIWDALRRRQVNRHRQYLPVTKISVIIPVLNEARNLPPCLEAVGHDRAVIETIVADGGSSDETRDVCRRLGITLIQSQRGRGPQIRAGIQAAAGDVILVLHADCRMRKGVATRILQELNARTYCIGGSLGMSYQRKSPQNRFIAWLNNMRARWIGIAFGDQGQFLRREALDLIGGFPDLALMEDVELSMRLKEAGPVSFLPDGVIVSSRRWEKMGFLTNVRKVIGLCFAFLIQRRLGMLDSNGQWYYNRYYAANTQTDG